MNTFHFAQSETNERFNKDFINVDDDQLIYWYIILAAYITKKNPIDCRRVYYANCALVNYNGSENGSIKIVLAILRTRCVDPKYVLLVWWPDTNRTELWNTEQVHKNYISDYTQPIDLAKCMEARALFFKQQKWLIRSDLAIPLSSGVHLGNPERMKKLNLGTCKEIFDAYAVHQGKRVAGVKPKILGPKFYTIYSGLVETSTPTYLSDTSSRTDSRILSLREKELKSREAALDTAEKEAKEKKRKLELNQKNQLKRQLELDRKNEELRKAKEKVTKKNGASKQKQLDKQRAPVVMSIPVTPTEGVKQTNLSVCPPFESSTYYNTGQMVFNPANPSVWFAQVALSALNQAHTEKALNQAHIEKTRDQLTTLAKELPDSIASNPATAALFVDAFKSFIAK